jgi:hypothetical protein
MMIYSATRRIGSWPGLDFGRPICQLIVLFSWIVLLSIPLVSMGIPAVALSGRLVLDPMWIVLSLILAVVFIHGTERVRWDLAGDRAGLQTHRHRNHPR